MAKDLCIICGKETAYDFETHIDYRVGYVEGAGQLCFSCYNRDEPSTVKVPRDLIHNTPNDFELGGKVRQMHYDTKNHS